MFANSSRATFPPVSLLCALMLVWFGVLYCILHNYNTHKTPTSFITSTFVHTYMGYMGYIMYIACYFHAVYSQVQRMNCFKCTSIDLSLNSMSIIAIYLRGYMLIGRVWLTSRSTFFSVKYWLSEFESHAYNGYNYNYWNFYVDRAIISTCTSDHISLSISANPRILIH